MLTLPKGSVSPKTGPDDPNVMPKGTIQIDDPNDPTLFEKAQKALREAEEEKKAEEAAEKKAAQEKPDAPKKP